MREWLLLQDLCDDHGWNTARGCSWDLQLALGPIHLSLQPFSLLRHKEPNKHCGLQMTNLEAIPKKTWHGAYQDCGVERRLVGWGPGLSLDLVCDFRQLTDYLETTVISWVYRELNGMTWEKDKKLPGWFKMGDPSKNSKHQRHMPAPCVSQWRLRLQQGLKGEQD